MAACDEELMQRTAGGDLSALGELFDRHRPALFRFLCRFLGEAATAEDTAQEVFWRVWQHRATFHRDRSFRAWLYVIARHAALDELRKSRRTLAFSELSEEQRVRLQAAGDGALFASAMADRLDLRSQVREALQALPPDQRMSLILREYEERSHREIGEIMGCSEGAARVLVHRARRALRGVLGPLLKGEESCV